MYAQYPRRAAVPADVVLLFPSPNESVSDLSEFTLLEGSSLTCSDSDTSLPQQLQSPPPTIITVYPRRSIPLLAFFAALLAVDDTTLHLLEHPDHSHSPLFPGPPLAHPGAEPDAPDTQHGIFRLLAHRLREC